MCNLAKAEREEAHVPKPFTLEWSYGRVHDYSSTLKSCSNDFTTLYTLQAEKITIFKIKQSKNN